MEGAGPVKAALGRQAPGVGAAGEAGALKKWLPGGRGQTTGGPRAGRRESGLLTPHPVVSLELPYLGPLPTALCGESVPRAPSGAPAMGRRAMG